MRHPRTIVIISLSVILLMGIAAGVATLAGWGPLADDAPGPDSSTSPSAPTVEPQPTATTTSPAPTAAPTATAPGTVDPTAPVGPSPDPVDQPDEPTPPGGTDAASVLITYASWEDSTSSVEVGAYAALVEPSGACTLTLTQGSVTTSQTIDALSDVSTMSCGGFQIGRSDLAPGTWSAVVTYESATSSGVSTPVEVTVP